MQFKAQAQWSPRNFAELAPDLMVEVKSPTDNLKKLHAKVQEFLAQGTQVGILIHPEQRWVRYGVQGKHLSGFEMVMS